MSDSEKILVIGAGVCGTTVARGLEANGYLVSVVDKGRGAGGRLSTRRTDEGPFNHGAPSFLMAPESAELAIWREASLIDTRDDSEACMVIPKASMNALLKALQVGLTIRFGVRVTGLILADTMCAAQSTEGILDGYSAVVLAIPAPQASALLPGHSELRSSLGDIEYRPQWTIMHSHDVAAPISGEHPDVEKVVRTASGTCAYLTHSA
ncbi:MAG: NAD(P)-binding protein, partial [Bradymonadia bacterium]